MRPSPVADRALERAHGCGPDRDDAALFVERAVERRGGRLADVIALALHAVLGEVVHFHRLKRADTDVQGDTDDLDATRRDFIQNLRCEVQPGGRRGDGASLGGVDRLVRLAVALARLRPGDVAAAAA